MPTADFTLAQKQANPLYALYDAYIRSGLSLEEWHRRLQPIQPKITPPFGPQAQLTPTPQPLTPPSAVYGPPISLAARPPLRPPEPVTTPAASLQLGTKEGQKAAEGALKNILYRAPSQQTPEELREADRQNFIYAMRQAEGKEQPYRPVLDLPQPPPVEFGEFRPEARPPFEARFADPASRFVEKVRQVFPKLFSSGPQAEVLKTAVISYNAQRYKKQLGSVDATNGLVELRNNSPIFQKNTQRRVIEALITKTDAPLDADAQHLMEVCFGLAIKEFPGQRPPNIDLHAIPAAEAVAEGYYNGMAGTETEPAGASTIALMSARILGREGCSLVAHELGHAIQVANTSSQSGSIEQATETAYQSLSAQDQVRFWQLVQSAQNLPQENWGRSKNHYLNHGAGEIIAFTAAVYFNLGPNDIPPALRKILDPLFLKVTE